ncbi:hypothetical protein ACFOQM_20015 [Paenibacillus sp. GCM10012307]|uniref:Uncharacterized protein n=1 Tax=Paenibacillus roseus TaxID=2798579 RepID=A0A934J8F7_9BACL|nr:hypothetical protein [Paenibacillus roseus]MBJ6363513.1 hypothetical protein [Paenibacillus roseus]
MVTKDQLGAVLSLVSNAVGHSQWVVGGSAGLLLRGLVLDVSPRDLDLYADEADALLIHQALASYAIDRQEESTTERYRSILSHYEIGGLSVELVGGFEVRAGNSLYKLEVRELLLPLGLEVQVLEGEVCTVAPLAHELWFNLLRSREDRLRQISAAMAADPASHLPAFKRIVQRNHLTPDQIESAYRWASGWQEDKI